MTTDINILGHCPSCGSDSDHADYACERCRMVYAIRLAAQTRQKQREYFAGRSPTVLRESKQLEAKLDQLLARMVPDPQTAPPARAPQPSLFGIGNDYYAHGG